MLRHHISSIFFAAQFLFFALPSQAQFPTSSCPCTLRGSVVDSVSAQPVPHALVKLTAPSPRAVLTDSEGQFQFEGLPAGSVTLEAEKPGFLTRDAFSRWSFPSVVVQLAPNSQPAVLKLLREGVISGHVSDENGEPLEGFAISVLPRGSGYRGLGLGPNTLHLPALTDDQGKFRIAGLRLGSYYLMAHQTQTPTPHTAQKSPVPSGYSPVFYPSASDIASAVPVRVLPGGTAQVNFSLKRVRFIRLSGTVSGYDPQGNVGIMLWDSSRTPPNPEISFDQSTGFFQTKWIPPGTYTLTAQSAGPVSGDASGIVLFASRVISTASDLTGLHLALQRTLEIPVVVHGLASTDDQAVQSVPSVLALIPKNSANGFIPFAPRTIRLTGQSGGDLHAAFSGAGPGTYELGVFPPHNSFYYIESAVWGSSDLLQDDLVLDSSDSVPPIEVVVRDDGATLNGKVFSRDLPLSPQVILLPDKRKKPITLLVGADGIFNLSGLAPGVYRIFAVDASVDFDNEDPSFLVRVSSKVQEITLSPKQSASVNLELATVEE